MEAWKKNHAQTESNPFLRFPSFFYSAELDVVFFSSDVLALDLCTKKRQEQVRLRKNLHQIFFHLRWKNICWRWKKICWIFPLFFPLFLLFFLKKTYNFYEKTWNLKKIFCFDFYPCHRLQQNVSTSDLTFPKLPR